MSDNQSEWGVYRTKHPQFQVNPPTFFIAAVCILAFIIWGLVAAKGAQEVFGAIQSFISTYAGWFYILTANIVLIFSIYMGFSRYGKVRLGGQDQEPEFGLFSWFSMLFSAGMGIGLLFYSVAEPLWHFSSPPMDPWGGASQANNAEQAMGITFLHWGLHPWAIYAVIALGLAYFGYNRNMPLSIRSAFYPLIGNRIYGAQGHAIDILATIATLFGVSTSLGLGVSQVGAGLNFVFGIPDNTTVQVILIAIITFFATLSVVAGLDGGIKRLSTMNMVIAAVLLVFVLFLGPTIFILEAVLENTGFYLQHFPSLALWNETYTRGEWQNSWTVFYYGWWISWSPFVGMFIARVSKGRTISEFISGVLLVPTAVTFLWLTIFGDAALYVQMFGQGGILEAVNEMGVSRAMFAFLETFPLSMITSLLATIVVITFFVTSSDSGSLVIDIITAGGLEDPPTGQRIFWAVTEGVVAATLLLGGGLSALQTAAITTGLPFSIILLILCYGLKKGLSTDPVAGEQAGTAMQAAE